MLFEKEKFVSIHLRSTALGAYAKNKNMRARGCAICLKVVAGTCKRRATTPHATPGRPRPLSQATFWVDRNTSPNSPPPAFAFFASQQVIKI